jgi:hypothetical protein
MISLKLFGICYFMVLHISNENIIQKILNFQLRKYLCFFKYFASLKLNSDQVEDVSDCFSTCIVCVWVAARKAEITFDTL